MNNNNTTYHPLGDYIRPVDVRNRDLQVTKLLGLSIEKCFIPSIANTIGTDMSTYKVVMPGQFAYGPVTSRNGDKITIALYTGDEPAIISQAYVVFEIMDAGVPVETHGRASLPDAPSQLLPEYLMMWFRRPEFDRYARYHSHGSAREIFDWAEMCATMVPVPPITEQRAVVADYEAVARRIAVAKRTIATLQDTAQTLYRKMFVDGIDKENLPEGWRWGKLGEVCEIKGGKRLPKGEELTDQKGSHPYLKVADMTSDKYVVLNNKIQYVQDEIQKQIQNYIVKTNDIILSIVGTIGNVNTIDESLNGANLTENCVRFVNVKKITSNYLYQYLVSKEGQRQIEQGIVGGVQGKLPIYNIASIPILVPSSESMTKWEKDQTAIDGTLKCTIREIEKLTETQTIILSGMGR